MNSNVFLFHPDVAHHLILLDIFNLQSTVSISSPNSWVEYTCVPEDFNRLICDQSIGYASGMQYIVFHTNFDPGLMYEVNV